jgi:hypothetical protein
MPKREKKPDTSGLNTYSLGCGDDLPPLQNDPRLALHISVVGVAEMDP